jgi:hypothetical protein
MVLVGVLLRRDCLKAAVFAVVACENEGSRGRARAGLGKPAPTRTRSPARERVAGILENETEEQLIGKLVDQLRDGLSLLELTQATFDVGLRRCHSEAAAGSRGIVSHALLGVAPSHRLAKLVPTARAPIPILQSAVFVSNEAKRSPYGKTPFELPPLAAATQDSDLAEGIQNDELQRAEAGLAAALQSDPERAALDVMVASSRELGHLGHGLIMGNFAALATMELNAPEAPRAVIRYITSFRVPDDTDARVAEASRSSGYVSTVMAAPVPAQALTASAADLVLRRKDGSLGADLHLFTSGRAAAEAYQRLQKAGRASDADLVLRRAASWLDMAVEGRTELGPYELAALPEPPSELPPTDLLVEAAVATSRGSFQHSVKLADATLADHRERGDERSWQILALNRAYVDEAKAGPEQRYLDICRALKQAPHPALS